MIDVTGPLATATDALAHVIGAMGTRVDFEAHASPGPVNPTTLTATTAVDTIAADVAALIAPTGSGGTVNRVPREPQRDGQWKIICLPNAQVDTVQEGHVIRVLTSRDTRLVGRTFRVVQVPDRSTGVGRIFIATALPQGGKP